MAAPVENSSFAQINALQSELDEVTCISRGNVEKIIRRGEKLEKLEETTTTLLIQTERYKELCEKVSPPPRRKLCKICLVVTVPILIVSLLVVLVVVFVTQLTSGR